MTLHTRYLNNKKGITLIALVITVIVLLILAGVAVATLTGDNGLLQKVQNAKQVNEESEICEQIKLAYAEYQVAQYDGTTKTAEEMIGDSLKTIYGNDKITKVKVKKVKALVNMTINEEDKTYIYNSKTGEVYEYVDIIDYKGKEKKI